MCDLGFEAWRVEMIHPRKQDSEKAQAMPKQKRFFIVRAKIL
jgi:hypothetical protein